MMGVDPIDEFLTFEKQQQIVKLFRFGTPEEIEAFEQSVVNVKSKSTGDNPTKQREIHSTHRKQLKRSQRQIKSLERKVKLLKLKALEKKVRLHKKKKRHVKFRNRTSLKRKSKGANHLQRKRLYQQLKKRKS